MADDSESVSSWPGFVDQLNKTFMLVRDAFGYALPGGAFLAIGLVSHRFSFSQVQALLAPYTPPPWMAFFAIVAVSYAVGGVMAACAYMPFMLAKYYLWMRQRHPVRPVPSPPVPSEVHEHIEHHQRSGRVVHSDQIDLVVRQVPTSQPDPPPPVDGTSAAWLLYHPTEVAAETLEIRMQQPKLLDTLDRRETLCLLSASMSSALLYGWVVFYWLQLSFATIIVCAAVVTYIQFLTGLPHLRRVTKSIYDASTSLNKNAEPKAAPDFASSLSDLIKAAQTTVTALQKKTGS